MVVREFVVIGYSSEGRAPLGIFTGEARPATVLPGVDLELIPVGVARVEDLAAALTTVFH